MGTYAVNDTRSVLSQKDKRLKFDYILFNSPLPPRPRTKLKRALKTNLKKKRKFWTTRKISMNTTIDLPSVNDLLHFLQVHKI